MVPLVACGLFALVPSRPDPGALSPAALPLGNADTNANVSAFSVVVPCFSRQGSVHRVLSNLLANTTASEVILVMQSRAVVDDKEGILDRVQRACEDPLRHNGTYRPNEHACDLSKLKVVDNVERNDEIFSAIAVDVCRGDGVPESAISGPLGQDAEIIHAQGKDAIGRWRSDDPGWLSVDFSAAQRESRLISGRGPNELLFSHREGHWTMRYSNRQLAIVPVQRTRSPRGGTLSTIGCDPPARPCRITSAGQCDAHTRTIGENRLAILVRDAVGQRGADEQRRSSTGEVCTESARTRLNHRHFARGPT